MNRSERAFRLLLHVYPRSFRDACGDDMAQLFVDQLRVARGSRSTVARLWLGILTDTLRTAPAQHLAVRRARLAQLVPDNASVAIGAGSIRAEVAAALLPIGLAVVIAFARPDILAADLDPQIGVLGLPLGTVVLATTGVLAIAACLTWHRFQRHPWSGLLLVLVMPYVLTLLFLSLVIDWLLSAVTGQWA